jgi:adenine phosphoribosyltransferase
MHIDQYELKKYIKTEEDWPIEGVSFKDLSPLFASPQAMRQCVSIFVDRFINEDFTHIAAIDARGFILGSILAMELNLPLIMIRKAQKLPGAVISEDYGMEYGTRTLEILEDSCGAGDKVLIFDDLLATGGSILAATKLVKRLGAEVSQIATIINLSDLGGEQKIIDSGLHTFSLMAY